MTMRYLGSSLAILTLVALAYAGSIDNSATRPYVNDKIDYVTGTVIPTSRVAYATSAGTAATATNWTGAQAMSNDLCGVVIPTSRVAYATSAGTSATTTNALQLGGILANRYPTNLAVDVTDPWHITSNVLSYSLSTLTVSRAMGEYLSWSLTNNATLCVDGSTYPSNGAAFVSVSLYIGSFSLTFCTNSISTNSASGNPPGSSGVVLTNNAWNSVILHRPYGSTSVLWGIRQ